MLFAEKTLDSSMDSEDVREDKDDEREKEKPLVGDLNDGYESSGDKTFSSFQKGLSLFK